MTKQHIYENILARKIGMYYSPGICFEKSIFNVDKTKALTKRNQIEKHKGKKRYQFSPNNHLKITLMDCPVGITYQKAKILTLDMGLSQFEAKKSVEEAVVEEEKRFLTEKDSVEDS